MSKEYWMVGFNEGVEVVGVVNWVLGVVMRQ